MADAVKDASNVGVAKGNTQNAGGYAWVAPCGTELPTDAKSPIPEAFESLGYISEDGLTNTTDTDSEDYRDWGGDVIKSALSSYSESYQAGFLESRATVLKTVYGDANVDDDGAGSITVRHNGNFNEERSYVFEALITSTLIKRTVIPRGTITERDDVSENPDDLLVYTPTIKALPDSEGNTSYVYYYDSAKAASSEDEPSQEGYAVVGTAVVGTDAAA